VPNLLSAVFQATVSIGAASLASMIALKAANDYCEITPRADPFAPEYAYSLYPERERAFCATAAALKPYNFLYGDDGQYQP
jgi:hypothetical protein